MSHAPQTQTSTPQVRIDLSALQHNLAVARRYAPGSKLLAVVKADAYGHGALRIAQALEAADAFAVARLSEAIYLRESGIHKDILLFEGVNDQDELQQAQQHQLQLVVHQQEQISLLQQSAGAALTIWLKIDTGMHRLGFHPQDAAAAYRQLSESSAVHGQPQLMTHLADADDRHSPHSNEQCEQFDQAVADLRGEQSIANSAALLGWPDTHRDWVRPGIMLYGASPFLDSPASDWDLKQVMSLETRLIATKQCKQGEAVGYGSRWQCPEDMLIGIAAIGYGDGYPRHAPDNTPVLVGEQRSGIIGCVSMDMLAIDLRPCPEAKLGDSVLLWGQSRGGIILPVDEVAQKAETIAYELFCQLTSRVKFVYQ
ncbi:Alanine racemase [hydrothermal vent metagenome]|uniref:Alanine racemase n=1 Tax=hydrothermal vent metagenome TaxID=652676 RepID=A0A3B1B1J7_9ZZZZ